MQTLPTLPSLAAVASTSGNITVDGVAFGSSSAYQPLWLTNSTSWTPISTHPSLQIYNALGAITADPWNATKARLVNVGYRIIYTGPVSTCAGSITVTPNSIGLSQATMVNTNAAAVGQQLACVQTTAAGGSTTTYCYAQTPVVTMDWQANASALNKKSFTLRPEEGVIIVPRYMAESMLPQDIFLSAYPAAANFGSAPLPNTIQNTLRTTSGTAGGIIWYDDNWEGYQILFNGINSDASFRIETVACIELSLSQNSAFAPLAKEVSDRDPAVLAIAKELNSKLPPVMSTQMQNREMSNLPVHVAASGRQQRFKRY